MSFVRIVRFLVCITLLLSIFVPQKQISGQSDNLTPVSTLTPQSSNTPESTSEAEVEDEFERLLNVLIDQNIAEMSVADRIGQLFVVAFEGEDVSPTSDIAELIYTYRIGGVMISPRNHNFFNARPPQDDAVTQVTKLTNQLQALSYGKEWRADFTPQSEGITATLSSWFTASLNISDTVLVPPPSLPLFIAVEQAGDGLSQAGLPDTALRRGFTELPSQLALGATWDPELTRNVGKIVGQELEAVGVNMLLGPYLDVLTVTRSGRVGTLGIYSFGGDPEWVSTMGRAYIEGVHEGGMGRVFTIARHFPGQGDSDRLPSEEMATIQSSSQELRRNHLPPFKAVTSDFSGIPASPQNDAAITDGMMSSHMYFSGLQGDPTAEVKPFGFSSQLQSELQPYEEWRENGLMMTNELGAPAIQRFYKASTPEFPVRQLVRPAFLAGHDLLYLSQFSVDGTWESQKSNIQDVITYFQELYDDDEEVGFRTRVDESVRRILYAKLRMYGVDKSLEAQLNSVDMNRSESEANNAPISPLPTGEASGTIITDTIDSSLFTSTLSIAIPLESVLISQNPYLTLANEVKAASAETIRKVAEKSLTLINPDPTGNLDPLPAPPQSDEKILIITDNYLLSECEGCVPENLVAPDEIQNIILRRYGDDATKQISANQIKSVTFEELDKLLNEIAAAGVAPEALVPTGSATEDNQTPSEIDADIFTQDVTPTPETSPEAPDDELAPDALSPQLVNLTSQDLEEADWILFAMLDIVDDRPSSAVVKRFLRERSEQLRNKRIIVFSLNAPYFLDGTEASRLTPYLGVNSKIRPFLITAVRTLFKEASLAIVPQGNAPVNVPGTRFGELSLRLLPDPDIKIPIQIFVDGELIAQRPSESEEANGLITISPTTDLRVRAFDIQDRNQNIVKDNTQIIFQIQQGDGNSIIPMEPAVTLDGETERIIPRERLPAPGVAFTILAYSDVDSDNSIKASSEQVELVIQPTGMPVVAELPTESAEITTTAEISSSQATADNLATGVIEPKPHIDWFTFLMSIVTILGMISILIVPQARIMPRQYLVPHMLWAVVVGLSVYVLYGMFFPVDIGSKGYPWAPPLLVFISMLVLLLWLQLRQE